jgi:hypothetical protein
LMTPVPNLIRLVCGMAAARKVKGDDTGSLQQA